MKSDLVVGIDLGTTYSAIAHVGASGRPEILPNAEGGRITPSVVQVRPDGSMLVGAAAKAESILEKENTAQFFKRDMGTDAFYEFHGQRYTPVDLSVAVLKKLKADAELVLGQPVRRAVITVPAYFHDGARVATRTAGERAGLTVLQVVNEPTAAAIAYGLQQLDGEQVVLVYDLGGGTFDVTLVRVHAQGVEVLGTDGNHALGGKDWDDRLVQLVATEFHRRTGHDPLDEPYTFQELQVRAEEAKKSLSERTRAVLSVSCAGRTEQIEVTRAEFEANTVDLITQTELLITNLLGATGFSLSRVDGVLLVGGSTRMPMCREFLRRLTGKPPRTTVNPDECVALGAALQAAAYLDATRGPAELQLLGRRLQIADVMSHSMGMIAVSADGQSYVNSVLIPRNRPIPCREVRPYRLRTRSSGRGTAAVFVTQGEGSDPQNCSFVGKYVITDITPGSGGSAVLDICYEYDRSGVISVSATERPSGRALPVKKEPIPQDMAWVTASPRRELAHKTVYLAIDLSGSMQGKPLADAKQAVRAFLEQSDLAHTSVGLISFAERVRLDETATQDSELLERTANAWQVDDGLGYTTTGHPFAVLFAHLKDVAGTRLAVILTDGAWEYKEDAARHAALCHAAGIEVIAVGFGSADADFLRRIATAPEGALFTQQCDLAATFGDIAQVLVESEDEKVSSGIRRRRPE